MEHGNFSGLALNYSDYRPGYSQSVLKALTSLLNKDITKCEFADVGAGTGIWTRMLNSVNPSSITAVEPNDDMRDTGIRDSKDLKINWIKGTGEETNLPDNSVDMVSMASSFHWVNFEKGCKEFHRILKDKGRFVALWNPRIIEANPLLLEVEEHLLKLKPDLKRVSSGRSGLVETLTNDMYRSGLFTDVIYMEGRHTISIDVEHYIGAWKSVNDVQFQLGKEKFEEFLQYVRTKLESKPSIEVTYLTRAWSALKI
jgi:ubiquinone/menaquinone biosynthesis C-methylase UbiE